MTLQVREQRAGSRDQRGIPVLNVINTFITARGGSPWTPMDRPCAHFG